MHCRSKPKSIIQETFDMVDNEVWYPYSNADLRLILEHAENIKYLDIHNIFDSFIWDDQSDNISQNQIECLEILKQIAVYPHLRCALDILADYVLLGGPKQFYSADIFFF